MELHRDENNNLNLSLSIDQLKFLQACSRESFATLHKNEYALRIGIDMDAGHQIAKELLTLMRNLDIEL